MYTKTNMWAKHKQYSGFTIVELLIVIVVIAILAAISIVAYNGIQVRARNSQTASAVNAYKKALSLYVIDKGSYPPQTDVCLGEGYPDMNSDGVTGDCSTVNSDGSVIYKVNSAFDTRLAPYLSAKPQVNSKVFKTTNTNQIGIQFRYIPSYTLNGASNPYWLIYKTEGISACPVGPIPTRTGSDFNASVPSSTGYTDIFSSDSVQCIIPLPNPT